MPAGSSMKLVTNGAPVQQAGDVVYLICTLTDANNRAVYVLDGVFLTATGVLALSST